MIITQELKERHDKLLEKIKKELFSDFWMRQTPTKYVELVNSLADLYAYFIRYDWDGVTPEPILIKEKSISLTRSKESKKEYLQENSFERDITPALKKYKKQDSNHLFDITGLDLLQIESPTEKSYFYLSLYTWNFSTHFPGITKVKHEDNSYVIYESKNIVFNNAGSEKFTITSSQSFIKDIQSFNKDTVLYIFDNTYEYLGRYQCKQNSISPKEDSVEFKVSKIWDSAAATAEIVPDYKESEKEKFSSERYKRDPQKRDESIRRAKGRCQNPACKCPESFLSVDGEPFLESHHIEFRSKKGPDILDNMIALCPNCHSMSHYAPEAMRLQLKKDFKKVIKNLFS